STTRHGALMIHDELSGFLGQMDRYSGGRGSAADRSFYLQAYNGGPFTIDRVSREAVALGNASLSMVAGVQPEPMREIARGSTDDGLLQRMLVIVLTRPRRSQDRPIPDVVGRYERLLEALVFMCDEGGRTLHLSPGARRLREELEAEHLEMCVREETRKFAGWAGKQNGVFARLCVLFHAVDHADKMLIWEEDPRNVGLPPEEVPESVAARVVRIMRGFLRPHARAFYLGLLQQSENQEALQKIGNYILAHRPDTFGMRDVKRHAQGLRGAQTKAVAELLTELSSLGWIDQVLDLSRSPAMPVNPARWRVNPKVHDRFSGRAGEEQARRAAWLEKFEGDAE
ncbi:MAG: DUF3987 domain-containing protein, partial [Tabrizicola sp.]